MFFPILLLYFQSGECNEVSNPKVFDTKERHHCSYTQTIDTVKHTLTVVVMISARDSRVVLTKHVKNKIPL